MPTFIYGPQAFTTGAFAKPSYFQTTDAGGSDAPITGYAEFVSGEGIKTDAGSGPLGENTLINDPSTGSTPISAGLAIANIGDLTGAYGSGGVFTKGWDVRGTYIEWDQNFSTSYMSDGNYASLLCVGNGLFSGQQFIQIDLNQVSGDTYDMWLGYAGYDPAYPGDGATGPINMDEVSGHRPTAATVTMDDAWHRMKLYISPATLNGNTGVPSADVNADGELKLWIDGVLQADLTGLYLVANYDDPTHGGDFAASSLLFGYSSLAGPITNIQVYRQSTTIIGSTVFGVSGTVTSTRTFLANLDNVTRTVNRPGTFFIGGDLVVTGDVIYTGTTTAPTSFYNSLVATDDGDLVMDSDGNAVFVEGTTS